MNLVIVIICAVIFAFLLPLMASMYMDIEQTKKEAQQSLMKVEQLRRKVEKERKKDDE